jgi:DNA repair protein RecN (Recombination protein N)
MLQELHIQNYAVIDNLCVEFQSGLNLLSGETGSGKSILIDALGLALAGRASPDMIRTGQERTMVTAVFRSKGRPPWAGWLEEAHLAVSDESEIILRREIQSNGKSRLLVNDQPVTLAAVKALVPFLVEVHGQSEHVALYARDAQLALLDQFAGTEATREKVGELHAQCYAVEREVESLSHDEQERLRTIDLLKFQVQELERAQLRPDEDARLEEEKTMLASLEKIRSASSEAFGELYDEEGSACSRLARVTRAVEELRRYDANLEPYLEPLSAARATLEDLAIFLRDYLGRLETNPRRLEEVEDRLALIDRMKRKYGKTIDEILAYGDGTRGRLSGLEHADERRDVLRRELEKAAADYETSARALSERRHEAARKLEKLVPAELAPIGMEKTRFEVHFRNRAGGDRTGSASARQGGSKGIDEIEFRISPNPGEEMRPLEAIASGGELSRLMLALKTVVGLARAADSARATRRVAPTFIFDEVDAGIGGRVAESVGQRLKRLSRDSQVLCVTHLAQIACFADHHFYVEKFERAGRTFTAVKYLEDDKERARELARMLSGSQITDAALKHAATMLKQAVAS